MTQHTAHAVRDSFEADYIAAREASRLPAATLAERDQAWTIARRIARAAKRAGIELDEIALDERARRNLYA